MPSLKKLKSESFSCKKIGSKATIQIESIDLYSRYGLVDTEKTSEICLDEKRCEVKFKSAECPYLKP